MNILIQQITIRLLAIIFKLLSVCCVENCHCRDMMYL